MSFARLVLRFQTPAAVLWLGCLLLVTSLKLSAAAPTAILLTPHTLRENCAPGTVVGNLTAVDADVGDTYSFALVTGDGSAFNDGFVISGNQLIAPVGISTFGINEDFEKTQWVFTVRIRVTDSALNSYEQALQIEMTDDRTEDADGDGLTEAEEEDVYGTSDVAYDSDLDGVGDGVEVAANTSPTNANQWPPNALLGWGDSEGGKLGATVDADTLAISTGQDHGLALQGNGTVRAWGGLNFYGQRTVPAGLVNAVAAAAGGDFWLRDSSFSLALKGDGTVIGWGCDTDGQIDVPAGLTGVVNIAAGRVHSIALKGDGTVVAWGQNSDGQASVPPGLTDVIAISAGGYHSLALKSDGTVVAWGNTFNGLKWQPVEVPAGLNDVVAVSAGRFHSLALRSDGTVVAWGYNENGQTTVPANLTGVVAISAGGFHSLALKSDGKVVAWGLNSFGQSTVPPSALANVKLISAGILHSLALRLTAGYPEITSSPVISSAPATELSHQILVANATPSHFSANGLPAGLSINATTGLITGQVASATRRSVRIEATTNRGVLAQTLWIRIFAGLNPTDIQLDGSSVPENSADGTLVGNFSVVDPDQGDVHTLELVAGAGSGDNARFRISGTQLLVNQKLARDFEQNQEPFSIRVRACDASLNPFEKIITIQIFDDESEDVDGDGLDEIQEAAAGTDENSYDTDGDGFGDGYEVLHGTLPLVASSIPTGTMLVAWGNNNKGQCSGPAALGDVLDLAAGWEHSLALRTDGTLIAWGRNDESQTNVPVGLSNVVAVGAGDYHSVALKSDGTVVAWGGGENGQATVPSGLTGVIAIAAGSYHNLALKSDGTVTAWGYNAFGQASVPAGLTNVVAIAAGGFHSLALKSDGTVVAWGSNWGGATSVPQDLERVVAISAGAYHSMALRSNGTIAVWGDSSSGQGFVPQALAGARDVAAGWIHSTVLKSDGAAEAWLANDYGQSKVPLEARSLKRIVAGAYHNLALRRSGGFPEIANYSPLNAWPGDVITYQINITGATPSHFEAIGLPDGLVINPTSGLISGTVVTGQRRSARIMVDTDKGRLTRILWLDTADGRAPTDMMLSSTSVTENQVAGTVGSLSTTDPDTGDVFNYQLIAGIGSKDNGYFTVSGNQLGLLTGFNRDFETDSSALSIRMMVTDSGLNTFEKVFTIPFLDDRTEDADGDGVSEAREEDAFHTSDSMFADYATSDGDHDGLPPLIEYAFNLSPTIADGNQYLGGAGSTSGLPSISLVANGSGGKVLRMEYLRRIASGLTYTPQFSSGLSPESWQTATQPVQVTPVNAEWERCKVDDSQSSPGSGKRFARVGVRP
ncbi:MAG: putative Ig domain-containing protein [Luteolibacter sp.]